MYSNGPSSSGSTFADAEVVEDRLLGVLVHDPFVADLLCHPPLPAVEGGDDLFDPLGVRHASSSRMPAARSQSSTVGTRATRA